MYPQENIDSPLPLYEVRELSMEEALLVLAAEKDLLDRQYRGTHWLDDAAGMG